MIYIHRCDDIPELYLKVPELCPYAILPMVPSPPSNLGKQLFCQTGVFGRDSGRPHGRNVPDTLSYPIF